jgi:hypothetical protein
MRTINNYARRSYDEFAGPQWLNPRQVKSDVPRIRYTRETPLRVTWKISLHSSNLQAQIVNYMTNVLTFTDI